MVEIKFCRNVLFMDRKPTPEDWPIEFLFVFDVNSGNMYQNLGDMPNGKTSWHKIGGELSEVIGEHPQEWHQDISVILGER